MISPCFNIAGMPARYCIAHKSSEMINVKNKKCKYEGCIKYPVFNYKDTNGGIYCDTHKLSEMIDVVSKRCKYEGCNIRPYCNYEGSKSYDYCISHKLPGMVNIKQPFYNDINSKRGIYCAKHKRDGMINVMDKKCKHEHCIKLPTYNYKGEKPGVYCNAHKLKDMINVKDRRCVVTDCTKIPNYNYSGKVSGLYCGEHKLDGMEDVRHKKCHTALCDTRATKKYKGYCFRCYIYTFPDQPVSKNYKTKEKCVVDYVTSTFPEYDWMCDKAVKDGCSRRRPDLLLDLGSQVLIVEVDENQHTSYDCSCENKRLMEISQDVGHRPVVFIRFNPDKYKTGEGIVQSCWTQNKLGICVIKSTKTTEWKERLCVLRDNIDYWINNTTDKTVEVVELYYDKM
jgi:hypothetical protein